MSNEDRLRDGRGPRRWGSDVIVDAVNAHGLRYLTMNPGSSFRAIHDSIVNYGANSPRMIQCTHEKIAVGIAHGYAKVTGEPIGCIVHDTVGLMHATLGVYYAYVDRVPVMLFGGAGPMAYERRRPSIDWLHVTNVQGNLVRDYTKWDDQPASIGSVHESVARGYRIAVSEPQGPVYLAFDAAVQEDPLEADVEPPAVAANPIPSRLGADPAALAELADLLVDAERPVLVPGYAGRSPDAMDLLVELAELLGAAVVDTHIRLNFPSHHPLNATGTSALEDADVVVFLDVKDYGKPTMTLNKTDRTSQSRIAPDARVADLGLAHVATSSWSHDFMGMHRLDLQVTADTMVALPQLLALCRERVPAAPARREARARWRLAVGELHHRTREAWWAEAEKGWDNTPVTHARLASAVWNVVREHDWVLSAGTAKDWALRLWDFDRPYRHPGISLGTGTQYGISLGVALAHKGTGRLVVDLQPDGDLMYDLGSLWEAAYHELPLLVVMVNNRGYVGDWDHQERLAQMRGTPAENAFYGMELDNPAPDFAAVARSFGWHAEGPIDNPALVEEAVRRAARAVLTEGRPALVDVVCGHD
ncbi:thiamine pyrophosphate-binding protein [Actinophytocola sp.]|uniref:thiamine pyrophosphate-binding protein n=1 Tax=Actinophytocola sp. TaxID=1872138 RepID=UPI0025C11501|nr:thiamine pyrophosphate-binding protein [Actinophytocola sp.]